MINKTQIYLGSVEDAIMTCKAGADFIGLVCDGFSLLPQSLEYDQAKAIFAVVDKDKMRVSLTISTQPAQVIEMIRNLRPNVVHLAGTTTMSINNILEIRRAEPSTKIMQTIPMNIGNPIQMAKKYQMACDYFLLDTADPNAADVGATGKAHDWKLSAQLVRETNIPVILAGGLTPENVREAIQIVQPWGVDSYSQTNINNAHGNPKDPEKVKRFIEGVKSFIS